MNKNLNLFFDGKPLYYCGNLALMNIKKTAFLSSNVVSDEAIKLSEEWAMRQAKNNCCVVSGFLSKSEQKVLNVLLQNGGYIIVVMATRLFGECPAKYKKAMDEKRILFLSTFDDNYKKVTKETATIRNKQVIDMASSVVAGCLRARNTTARLIKQSKKPCLVLCPIEKEQK